MFRFRKGPEPQVSTRPSSERLLAAMGEAFRRRYEPDDSPIKFEVTVAEAIAQAVTLEFVVQGVDGRYAATILLPSAGVQPWEYAPPHDADDWVGMLIVFLEENILTGATGWGRVTPMGDRLFWEVTRYGFRVDDDREHYRMLATSEAWQPDHI